MMNDVISKLVEIEAAAVKITENTNAQKARIAQDSEKRQEDYDRELQESVDSRIVAMKAENDVKIQQRIARMREETEQEMASLVENYQTNHERLAQDIIERLTGV